MLLDDKEIPRLKKEIYSIVFDYGYDIKDKKKICSDLNKSDLFEYINLRQFMPVEYNLFGLIADISLSEDILEGMGQNEETLKNRCRQAIDKINKLEKK